MPSLVSRIDSFCNVALDAGLEVGSSALFLSAICGCYSHLLVVPLHSHMSRPLSSLACVISRSQRSKLSLQIHRNSKTYQALYPSCATTCQPLVRTIIAHRPTSSALSSSLPQSSASGAPLASSSAPLSSTHTSSPPTSACIWLPSLLPVLIHLLQTSLSSSSPSTPSSPSVFHPLDVPHGPWCLSNHGSVPSLEFLKSGGWEIILEEDVAWT